MAAEGAGRQRGGGRMAAAVGEEDDDPFGVNSINGRPEVRFINRYVLLQTCVLMAVRGLAFMVLTWSTVVFSVALSPCYRRRTSGTSP
uniref:Uncharacterized protein n=1 Tax=Oryza glumipatula TaxID=40148 RepID=A0A0E0BJC6_9ORYZ